MLLVSARSHAQLGFNSVKAFSSQKLYKVGHVCCWQLKNKSKNGIGTAHMILASPKTTSCHNSPLIECGIFIFRLIDNWILWNLSSRQTATKLNNTLYHHKAGRIQNRFFFPLSARIGCFQTSGDVIERRELHHERHDEYVALHTHRSESRQYTRIV